MTLRLTFFIAAALVAQVGSAQLFGNQQIISTDANGANSVHTADLDGDGDLDVLAGCNVGNEMYRYENLGGGNFGPQMDIWTMLSYVNCVYSADLDGDGDQDVLAASAASDRLSWYENLGSGIINQPNVSWGASGVNCVRTGDIDGDGDLDLLATAWSADKVIMFENLGEASFSPMQIISTEYNSPTYLNLADIDGDDDLDLIVCSYYNILECNDSKVAWHENLGGGLFGSRQVISADECGMVYVLAADLDEDGDMDILTAAFSDDLVIWYENLGLGQFSAPMNISTEADGAYSVFAADLDLDGDFDVLSASVNDDKIAWYENLGGGVFGSQQIITTLADYARDVKATDIDGDGDMDVLSASNYDDKIAWYENLTIVAGCTDPLACNYATNANVGNGSCCYTNCGCTNPIAANYSESALCDNGSCEFLITGTVFYDENGVMDGAEYGLPFQTVVMQETGQTYITNNQGNFTATAFQHQMASLELTNTLTFPYNTTPNPQIFDADTSATTQLFFGVSNEYPDFAICIDLYPNGSTFLCNAYSNHNICFRNMGNVPIDGIVEIEYAALFQGHQEVTSIDSVNGNTVYMSFENLLPGQMFFYDIRLLTPTVDHIGEFVTSYARIYGYYDGAQVAYGERELTMEIACAYDPNDKQAFPLGYTDEHWLLQETEQEFLIRFQNTGNAPAQNIRIQDTLDVNFDISSFKLIANSHSVMATINPTTRLIDFYFENIQLPDSVNNEPDSHGLISYKITPLPNLPVGTVLENTAYIYFDNNDPIVTNTTWTTIHECGGEAAFDLSATEICAGEAINFAGTYEQVESYQWKLNSTPESTEESFSKIFDLAGEYTVQLEADNPLCNASSIQTITVHETPDLEVTSGDSEICASGSIEISVVGENVTINSWVHDNEIITQDSIWVQEFGSPGEFIIELRVENEFCSNTNEISVTVHENPSADFSTSVTQICAGESVTFDGTGNNVDAYSWFVADEMIGDVQVIAYTFSESGEYAVELSTQNEICTDTQSQTIIVHENPSADFSTSVTEICAGENVTFDAVGNNVDTYSWFVVDEMIGVVQSIAYTFNVAGEYAVELSTQNEICTDTQSQTIIVHENPSGEFSASATEICAGESVAFDAVGNNVDAYFWFVVDEMIGVVQSIAYAFNMAGEYAVELSAQNAMCTNTQSQTIIVHESPSADFSTSVTEICAGENVTFDAVGNNVDTYSWFVADEMIGDVQSIAYTFTEAGEYAVELSTQNDNCSETQSQTIIAHENPSGEFSASATEICAGESVTFDAVGNNVDTYSWFVVDEMIGDVQSIVYAFNEAGEYAVELSTQNEICTDTQSQTIIVFPNPTVQFTHDGDLLTASDGVAFQWYLNGEAIDGATAQQYSITEDGIYSVELTNEYNCTSTSEGIMIIGVLDVDSETILLYPNPMTDKAYLEFEDFSTKTVRLLDDTGKEVRVYQSVNVKKLEITNVNLAAGNYIVTVQQNNGTMHSLQLLVK